MKSMGLMMVGLIVLVTSKGTTPFFFSRSESTTEIAKKLDIREVNELIRKQQEQRSISTSVQPFENGIPIHINLPADFLQQYGLQLGRNYQIELKLPIQFPIKVQVMNSPGNVKNSSETVSPNPQDQEYYFRGRHYQWDEHQNREYFPNYETPANLPNQLPATHPRTAIQASQTLKALSYSQPL